MNNGAINIVLPDVVTVLPPCVPSTFQWLVVKTRRKQSRKFECKAPMQRGKQPQSDVILSVFTKKINNKIKCTHCV